MTFPSLLKSGDTIGIVSPSSVVNDQFLAAYENGITCLSELGFSVVNGQFVFSDSWGYAASPQEKAQDINRFFADPKIQAILCTQGGASANACLPYLDWDLIRRNPKVFMGISDITVLLNAINRKTGLVTFHGNDLLWGFGNKPTNYDLNEFRAVLVDGRQGVIPPNGKRTKIRAGQTSGRLVGGNLDCLLKLSGTEYFPNCENKILFLEAYRPSPEGVDSGLQHLKQLGVFEKINGVLVGFIDGLDNDPDQVYRMENILLRVTAEYDFPILKCQDFGHNTPNTVLPVGASIRIDADQQTMEFE